MVEPAILTNKVKKFREIALMSQGTLAYHIGTSRQEISKIEKGKVAPSISMALKLAIYFDVDVNQLFQIDWWPNEEPPPTLAERLSVL